MTELQKALARQLDNDIASFKTAYSIDTWDPSDKSEFDKTYNYYRNGLVNGTIKIEDLNDLKATSKGDNAAKYFIQQEANALGNIYQTKSQKKIFSNNTLKEEFAKKYYANGAIDIDTWNDLDAIDKKTKKRNITTRVQELKNFLNGIDLSKYDEFDNDVGSKEEVQSKLDRLKSQLEDGTIDANDYMAGNALGFDLKKLLNTDGEESSTPASPPNTTKPDTTEPTEKKSAVEAFIKDSPEIKRKKMNELFATWKAAYDKTKSPQQFQVKTNVYIPAADKTTIKKLYKEWYRNTNNGTPFNAELSDAQLNELVQSSIGTLPKYLKNWYASRTQISNFVGTRNGAKSKLSRGSVFDALLRYYTNNIQKTPNAYYGNLRLWTINDTLDRHTGFQWYYSPDNGQFMRINYTDPNLVSKDEDNKYIRDYFKNDPYYKEVANFQDGGQIDVLMTNYKNQGQAQKVKYNREHPQKAIEEAQNQKLDISDPANITRLVTLGMDLGSVAASFSGAGAPVAGALGIGSTLGDLGADIGDAVRGKMAASDVVKNVAMNAGWAAVGLIPFVGGATKLTKVVKSLTRLAPLIISAFQTVENGKPAIDALGRITKGNGTQKDFLLVSNTLRAALGGIQTGKINYSHWRNKPVNMSYVTVQGDLNKKQIPMSKADIDKYNKVKNSKDLNPNERINQAQEIVNNVVKENKWGKEQYKVTKETLNQNVENTTNKADIEAQIQTLRDQGKTQQANTLAFRAGLQPTVFGPKALFTLQNPFRRRTIPPYARPKDIPATPAEMIGYINHKFDALTLPQLKENKGTYSINTKTLWDLEVNSYVPGKTVSQIADFLVKHRANNKGWINLNNEDIAELSQILRTINLQPRSSVTINKQGGVLKFQDGQQVKQPDQLGSDVVAPQIDPKIQQRTERNYQLTQVTPRILQGLQALRDMQFNTRNTNKYLNARQTPYQTTFNTYSPIHGDYYSQQTGRNSAAALSSLASRAYTSNANAQLTAQLQAKDQGQKYIDAGNLADQKMILATKQAAKSDADNNIARANQISNKNLVSNVEENNFQANIRAANRTANHDIAKEAYLNNIVQPMVEKAKELDAIRKYLNMQQINNMINATGNQSLYQQAKMDEYKKLLDEATKAKSEGRNEDADRLTTEANAVLSNTQDIINERRFKATQLALEQLSRNYGIPWTFGISWTPGMNIPNYGITNIQSHKDGGQFTDTILKVLQKDSDRKLKYKLSKDKAFWSHIRGMKQTDFLKTLK